jgi:hypothetical protein
VRGPGVVDSGPSVILSPPTRYATVFAGFGVEFFKIVLIPLPDTVAVSFGGQSKPMSFRLRACYVSKYWAGTGSEGATLFSGP